MNTILIACEFSGIVRDAFLKAGKDAISCDLLPSESEGPHICDNVLNHLHRFNRVIAFPPCTRLCVSGARWFRFYPDEQKQAIKFFMSFVRPETQFSIENPIGIMSSRFRKPDQIIQPWMFGHGETKAICLWLNKLPKLEPTNIVSGRIPRVHYATPSPNRWKERSRTLPGIAQAMASQWF